MSPLLNPRLARALSVGFTTFVLAISVNFVSKILLGRVGLVLGLFVLLGIVFIGVFFDVIGTASTAAKAQPFHAMAAKRVYGARQSLRIVRSADRVASFCNDVVGDMAGTVSGAVGASVALRLASTFGAGLSEALTTTLVVGLAAALMVGGKAWSKSIALNESEKIVLAAGKVLAWVEGLTGLTFLRHSRPARRRRQKARHKHGWRERE